MYKRKISYIIIFLFAFVFVIDRPVFGQNISQMNFSNMNVDNLSDDQIRQFMLQVQQTGLSDNQIEQVALAKGMSATQLQKLETRIAQIRAQDSLNLRNAEISYADTSKLPLTFGAANDTTATGFTILEEALNSLKPKIFGQELFQNPNMTFQPDLNIPTPQNYQIGPGDGIVIDIYGYSQADYNLTVSNEGSINIPYIGIVYVNGLTLAQATEKIKSKLSPVYSTIKTGKTSVQVSIGQIRSIQVTLLGEVVKPGTYTLPSLASVFNALYASGGPTANGSFRNIEVVRNNKVIDTVDIYDFLMNGDQSKNIRLQDQDVINIPVYNTHVEISGQVKRPGIYETKPGESLSDVLKYAGGFTDSAYTALIKAIRLNGQEKQVEDIPKADFASFVPHTGDEYYVSSVLDKYTNRVFISGAVYRPGQYSLTKGLTLSGLIQKADGLREDAFLPHGYIIRQNPDLTTSAIQFNVADIMDGNEPDIPLQKEDSINIYSIFDLRDQYMVSIYGDVRDTGSYKYSDSLTLEDLIMEAGGFNEGASHERIEVSRRVIDTQNVGSLNAHIAKVFDENVGQDLQQQVSAFKLKPFDMVIVRGMPGYQTQGMVEVVGEVRYPGLYTLTQKNERISDIIKRAGGLTQLAYPEGASLKRTEKIDTSSLEIEKEKAIQQLQALNDSTGLKNVSPAILHNDYVGIYLDKILANPDSRYDLYLEKGDILYVPRKLQTVQINGEVLYPVNTAYIPGKRMGYYISQGGGFTGEAKTGRVYVVYANGFVKSTRHFLFFKSYPALSPGADIFVPQKPEANKLSASEVIGLTSGVTSIVALIVTLIRVL